MNTFALIVLWFIYSNDGGAFGFKYLIYTQKENDISLRNVNRKHIHVF